MTPRSTYQFLAIGERIEAGGRVVPVQAQVEGEVVAGARADDQERQAVLGGDAGHQRLGPVTAGHPQQVSTVSHRLAGQRGDIAHAPGLLAGPPRRPAPPPSPSGGTWSPCRRPTAGSSFRNGRCGQGGRGSRPSRRGHRPCAARSAPTPAASTSSTTATMATQSRLCSANITRISTRAGQHQDEREPADHPPVGQEPVATRQHQAHPDRGQPDHGQAPPPGHRQHQHHGRQHQHESGDEPASAESLIVMPPDSTGRATISSAVRMDPPGHPRAVVTSAKIS